MMCKEGGLDIDTSDEILRDTLVTTDGKIVHPRLTASAAPSVD
ncbi:MAG: hypothetical protein AAF108_12350 [Planctomycetota bacterium]